MTASNAGPDAERLAVLRRTGLFFPEFNTAVSAINEYLRRWPEHVTTVDVSFARECVRLVQNLLTIAKGGYQPVYEDNSWLADVADVFPPLLANGVLTSARIVSSDKRAGVLASLAAAHQACATAVQPLHEAAARHSEGLMVGGRTRAVLQRVTMDEAYRDAEIHYASYTRGDLEAALHGFEYMRDLAPTDAYFRNMVGSILQQQGKPLPALQEYLWGLSHEPLHAHLAQNVMRCLCGLALFPAAVEVARHYENIGGDMVAANLRPWALLARAVTASVVTTASRCSAEDVSADAPDLLDEFVVPDRPWLTQPESATAQTTALGRARIFISYRRSGGVDYAERLERALKSAYPAMRVFRDETALVAGQSFVDRLRAEIDEADVFLALMDRDWIGSRGGKSRLHDRDDVLGRELVRALDQEVPILPVLLGDATMPAARDLPEDLRTIPELHARRLSDATFDNDVGFLLSELTTLVTGREGRRNEIRARLDDLEKEETAAPGSTDATLNRMFRPWVDRLPRFVGRSARKGEGVSSERVQLEGLWECTATGAGGQVTLKFTADGTSGTPFEGEWTVRGTIASTNPAREDIRGSWVPIYDLEQDRVLGVYLDGLKSGALFKLEIPFHRVLGKDLVGTGADGITWSSRNLAPRRGGF